MSIAYIVGYSSGSGTTAMAAGLATYWKKLGKKVSLVGSFSYKNETESNLIATISKPLNNRFDSFEDAGIDEKIRLLLEWEKAYDVVVVDGGTPSEKQDDLTKLDSKLIDAVNANVLGVIGYNRFMKKEEIEEWSSAYGDHFKGIIVNKCHKYSSNDIESRLVPELNLSGISTIGTIPEERTLIAPTVAQLVEHIGGKYFTNADKGNSLVEHLLIGGLITEWGGNYFNRFPNQAVIVRGGRIDIQMSALNFPLNLLVLTKCETPSQYVFQRAEDLDVPLVTVPLDTHQTMTLLETVCSGVGIIHPEKIDYLSGLLGQRLDSDLLGRALGVQ